MDETITNMKQNMHKKQKSNLCKCLLYNSKLYHLDPDLLVFKEPTKNPKTGSISVEVKAGIHVGTKLKYVPILVQTPKMKTKWGYNTFVGDSKDGGNATFTSNSVDVVFEQDNMKHRLFEQTMEAISTKCKMACTAHKSLWFKNSKKVTAEVIDCGFSGLVRSDENNLYPSTMKFKIYTRNVKSLDGTHTKRIDAEMFDTNGELQEIANLESGATIRCVFEFRSLYFGTSGINIWSTMRLKQIKKIIDGAVRGRSLFIEDDEDSD